MARCSNGQVAKILASGGGVVEGRSKEEQDEELNRKIALVTEDSYRKQIL